MGGRSPGGNAGYPSATADRFPPLDPADAHGGFVIGVVDTGFSLHDGWPHPYLAGHLADSWRSQIDGPDGMDSKTGPRDGHGTFIAGLILREASFATIEMRNACDGPISSLQDNDTRVAAAIRDLTAVPNLRVLNATIYGLDPGNPDWDPPQEIRNALRELFAAKPDVVVVSCVANDWNDTPSYPAAFNDEFGSSLVAVGAVDETVRRYDDTVWRTPPLASFANFGGVDVWAGGVAVLGPHHYGTTAAYDTPGALDPYTGAVPSANGWARWSGSSFAGATVCGMLARALHKDPNLSGKDALARITAGRPCVASPGDPEGKPYVQGFESPWPGYVRPSVG